MQKNKVAILGLGYVGLPLAKLINSQGDYQVVGFDISESLITKLQEEKDLSCSLDPGIIADSEYFIICVPTPVEQNKLPNLTPLKSATATVAKYLEAGQSVIIESTVNPGVCEEVVLPILEETGLKGGQDFHLSHCPERINPGDPKWNVSNIPRNIGSLSEAGNKKNASFYRSFLDGELTEMSSLKAAEASKIIENTFRDINIAYVNELAKSFDIMGIDLLEVIRGASSKPFAFMAHYPGCGVGGHCIPVDPYYLINKAESMGFEHDFLKQAREVNESMPAYTVSLLNKAVSDKSATTVGVLGLSYKADVPDLRESPSLKILKLLKEEGYREVISFDPHFPEKSTTSNLEELLEKSDALMLTVNHQEFLSLDAKKLKNQQIKIVIDGKNCLNKKALQEADIYYKGIGH